MYHIFSNFAEAYDVVRHLSKNEKTMAGLHFDITGDNSNLLRKLQESERAIKAVSKTVEQEGGNIEELFNRLARSAAAIGVGFSAKEFISKAAQIRGEFQKLEVAFTTMLGSREKAEKLMEQMVRTAATTPFSLQDVAGGAKQLLAYGIEAEHVNETLIRLGDIAAGLSIPLGDLVYLYGTTRAQGRLYTEDFNQFTSRGIPMIEMLAEKFGVAESEVKGLVEAGKVGFPEVQEVIEKLTNEGGKFGGLMEAQSKTIAGQISNIEDAIETMFNDIGKANEGVINEALSGVSYLVENYEKVGREVLAVAAAYGTYKAVLMSVAAYQSVMVGVTYSTEIAELSKLIPLKQQSANEDIIAAVAAGRLTTAKAEQVIAIRTEIEAKRSSMQATLAAAQADTSAAQAAYKSALQRSVASKQAYAAKLKELEASKAYYANEALYNAAKTQQLSALADERSAAAKAKKVAAQNLEIARSKQNVAATALETFNTQANTAAQTANARSTNLLTVAKTKLAAASKALGLSMLANPYVVAAAAVATLTYGIYKLATADTAAEKAAKRHREEREKYVKVLDERREKIEQLIRVIQDETETEYTQIAAYEQLALLSPALVKSYTREELAVASLTETTKKLNKERDEADYQNIVANVDKYSTAIKGARAEAERLREEAKRETDPEKASHLNYLAIGQDMSANKSEEILKLWRDDLEEANRLRKKAEEDNKPIKIRLLEAGSARDEIVQELNAAKLELQEWQEKIKESPFMTIPFDVQIRFNNAQSKLKEIDETITNLQGQAGGEESNYQQDYDAAKKAWDEAKKKLEEIEKDKKAFTSKQYEEAKTYYDDKKKKYESLGGITSDKAINDAKKQAEEQKKLQQELYETLIQLRFQNQQDEINLMEEGSEKKRKQIELDYQKEIDAYNKAKAKFGETDEVKQMKANAEAKRYSGLVQLTESENKAATEANERYLKEYGTFMQKRQAIISEYTRKISEADTEGDRKILRKQMEEAISSLKFEELKKSPEYIRAFEDLDNTSTGTLESLLRKLEEAKITASEVLNPEDLREYTSTIQQILDELDERNPFQALSDRKDELIAAENALAEAKERLDKVNRGDKVVSGQRTWIGEDGKIHAEDVYLDAAGALEQYNKAKDKASKAGNRYVKAEEAAKDKVDELTEAIKGVGESIGGQAGEIISLIGDVSLFATSTIDGITRVSQTGANAISAVEKASVILGIVSAAIQVMQKISELGNNKAFKQYEAYAEKINDINALTDAVNQYAIAVKEAQRSEEGWFSTDNLKNLRDFKDLNEEVMEAYVAKASEAQAIYQNESGGGWLTGAFNWVMGNMSMLSWWDKWKNIWGQGDYAEGTTAAINNLRIETRKKSSGFLGTGIGGHSQKTEDLVTWAKNQGLGDLFDEEGLINKELAQSLIDNYGDKLVGQTKETLEELIELREKYDEYIEQLHEYVSSLYEPLVNNFVDSLWDWFDEGKNALDSFKEYASDTFRDIVSDMLKTIILDKVVGSFGDDIADIYEKYASGDIDVKELMNQVADRTDELIGDYESNIPTLQDMLESVSGMLSGAGIDLKDTSYSEQQSASSRGFGTEMTHEDAGELSGRFTALYEVGLQILQNISVLQSISVSAQSSDATLLEIKNLMILSNGHLEDISTFSKKILDGFGKKLDDINANLKNAL